MPFSEPVPVIGHHASVAALATHKFSLIGLAVTGGSAGL
jgi:hypothetical protein